MTLFKTAPTPPTLSDNVRDFIYENGDEGDIEQFEEFLRLIEWADNKIFDRFTSVEAFMEWASTGMGPLMSEIRVEVAKNAGAISIARSQGMPAEPDLEDALTWAECATFQGSEKQIKWARDIASKNLTAIALAQKKNQKIPTAAKWWIDHRNNIVVSLPLC